MKAWPAIAQQLLAVAILAMAAVPAAVWARFYCYYFGSPVLDWYYSTQHTIFQEPPSASFDDWRGSAFIYFLGSLPTVVWVIGLGVYIAGVRRKPVGLLLAILPISAFVYESWNELMYAYPLCNSF
jgi:hypothetical protein